jgi:hypothetical protein
MGEVDPNLICLRVLRTRKHIKFGIFTPRLSSYAKWINKVKDFSTEEAIYPGEVRNKP